MSRPQEVSTDSEEILHDTVNRREPLELSGRLEAPHLALPLTRRLVGDLGSIVRVLISDVDHGRHHGAARGGVGAQLVRLEFPILSLNPELRQRCVAPGVWPPPTR